MTNTKSKTVNWKKLLRVAALGAFALAPLASSTQAQAEPPDHAPAWGYRNKNKGKNKEYKHDHKGGVDRDGDGDYDQDDRRYENDNDDDDDNDGNDSNRNNSNRNNNNRNDTNRREYRTLEGVVTRDLSGNNFTIRTNNNQRVLVQLDQNEPNRLSEGDTVRVYGYFRDRNSDDRRDNNVFHATSLNIVRDDRNNTNNNGDNHTVTGTVASVDRNSRRLTVFANSRTLTVYTRDTFSSSINRGDRVRVTGDFNNQTVRDARVELISNGNGQYGSNDYSGTQVNFPATVIDRRDNSDTLRVRGDNGREYSVRWRNADSYKRGDHVRIFGRAVNGLVIASNVDRIR